MNQSQQKDSNKNELENSILLTKVIIYVLWFIIAFSMYKPLIIKDYFFSRVDHRNILIQSEQTYIVVYYIFYYLGLTAIAFILKHLYQLITNIQKEDMFTSININHLRFINNYISFGTAITAVAMYIYKINLLPIVFVAFFVDLIIKIITYVFRKAKLMKEDLDLTI